MKRLYNENIERAAEWLKVKKELENKLKELNDICEHWVVYDCEKYINDYGRIVIKNCLRCDFCNKIIENENNKDEIYKDFYEKQKKIFDHKYRTN